MGKRARQTPYKKLLKEEKAKTKLKVSHKTILPKGQNVTNPSFKVRKIIVKSQLKERSDDVVSKSNGNVKELIQRLQHHNTPLRINSLTSLCEIVEANTGIALSNHLSALIHAASHLTLDADEEVRTEAIKLLSAILKKNPAERLSELFEIIIRHLACAMSHINTNIRSSSLAVLDVLIARYPKLTAKHCQPVILPAFLDLISTKYADSERKLMMQYSDNMTTTIWRIKVLTRLQILLKAIVSIWKEKNFAQEEQEYVKRIKWEDIQSVNISLYRSPYDTTQVVDLSRLDVDRKRTQFDQDNEVKNYTALLMPLLLDIFSEVSPRIQKNRKTAQLSNEAGVLLKLIADIISLLWQIFETSHSSNHLKSWFSVEFGDSFLERVITKRFPYTLLEHNQCAEHENKKGKNPVTLRGILGEYSKFLADQQCVYLNATLSHVYLQIYQFNKLREFGNVVQYITSVLPSCLRMDRESVAQLLNCADALFALDLKQDTKYFDTVELIKVITQMNVHSTTKNDSRHTFVHEKTFNYLYKIVLNEKQNALNYPELATWLDSLPCCLTKKNVSLHTVKCIVDVARCNIPAFTNSLDAYIESILDNLPRLEIIIDRNVDKSVDPIEGKKLIANLLYYVQTWDDEMTCELKKGLVNGYFGNLKKHIEDAIECKSSSQ